MRRLLPWALLLLLGIGTAVGAAVGAAESPSTTPAGNLAGPEAQQWLTGVLAATKAAGTAHVDWVSVTASPNPNMRGSGAGSGVVNFATEDFRLSVTQHSISFSSQNGGPLHPLAETTTNGQIAIGQSVYENFGLPGLPDDWNKQSFPRDTGVLGLDSANAFGAVLSPLGRPFSVVAVTYLGPAVVSGAATTRYLVEIQAEPRTGEGCPKVAGKQRKALTGHVRVWVDDRDRLVQARVITSLSSKAVAAITKDDPSFDGQTFGPFTVTNTLRFSQFGTPVRITRPPLNGGRSSSTFSVGAYSSGHSSAVFCG